MIRAIQHILIMQDQGRFVLTYEPASSRFYANSRTETLRSVTDESCEFVRAMEDGGKTDVSENEEPLGRTQSII